jgi:hypothetical protein
MVKSLFIIYRAQHSGHAMCPMYNESEAAITKDDEGPNDGSREVGRDIFERMDVLRWDGRFKNVYEDVYVKRGRRVNNLAVQREEEFCNASAGAGAGEKVSGRVGAMLEACRLRVDSGISLEDVEELSHELVMITWVLFDHSLRTYVIASGQEVLHMLQYTLESRWSGAQRGRHDRSFVPFNPTHS